jgi:hypothetical protein
MPSAFLFLHQVDSMAKSKGTSVKGTDLKGGGKKNVGRARVFQTDVPAYSLDYALRISKAILVDCGDTAAAPLDVARVMGLSPTSSLFRMLCGASIAFGLTEGGYNADEIKVQPLATRIVETAEEGNDLSARREAALRPRVIREFLTKYDGRALPKDNQWGSPTKLGKRHSL